MDILILNVILSFVFIGIINAPIWLGKDRGSGGGLSVALLVLGLPFALTSTWAVLLQALLTGLGLSIWLRRQGSRGEFLAISAGAMFVSYAFSFGLGVLDSGGFRELKRRYPMESLEPRLAGRKPEPAPLPISVETKRNLTRVEEEIEYHHGSRAFRFKQLHRDQLSAFIMSSGFGVTRMNYPGEFDLRSRSPSEPPTLQPAPGLETPWPTGQSKQTSAEDTARMNDLLVKSVVNFANPEGFGYFQDRRHVGGFESHRFSEVPGPAESWKVERLELVSLLLHDVPVVYVSDKLPAMYGARKQPTRHLDPFETLGLYALREGRELYVEQAETEIRMLGAVRASKPCLACHEANEADLLGAFSYRLRAVSP